MPKRPASLSLDLDNKWSYMKTHGDPGWETFPSYLDAVVPRVLEFLSKHNLKITFFVVGQDAAIETNQQALRSLATAGHEIGNHSFHHEPWLHLYSLEQIDEELLRAEDCIREATGQKPVGFRGPGFSVSAAMLETLHRHQYRYDCSTFPTFLGPLARAYYFMTTKLSEEEKEQRKKLFGTFSEGLRPNKPYLWSLDGGQLIEVPVTTMPIFRIPIHASYVLYLAKFSPLLALTYFRIAIALCRLTGVEPSILLHPLDFMTQEDAPELGFFPAMKFPLDRKLKVMDQIIQVFSAHYDILPMSQYVERARTQKLSTLPPKF
jgi:peptidoglycan/xylan/chitin deacetylase (PgdA/CDA1 family)